jgi:hypothetical protein
VTKRAYRPIETEIGILNGRDAIYLDSFEYELHGLLRLSGEFNGRLASKPVDKFVKYVLTFNNVLAFKVIELDSWDYESASSFDEIVDSEWCRTLGGKITPHHKHYLFQTYDDVIEVVADKFTLIVNLEEV